MAKYASDTVLRSCHWCPSTGTSTVGEKVKHFHCGCDKVGKTMTLEPNRTQEYDRRARRARATA